MNKVAMGTVASVSAGQSAPKQTEFSDRGIPFIRAGSLEDLLLGKDESDLELVPEETARRLKLRLYPRGSILFAKSGMSATKDRIYVLQNPAHAVSHLAILIPNNTIHTEYLRLALKKFPPSILIKDLSYPAISLAEIQDYEIPVPEELQDQIRIAHLLGKVEGLIAQRKQHLQQLDDLLKSVFLEMFGDPVRNDKGWNILSLGSISDVQGGLQVTTKRDSYPLRMPYLRVANVYRNRLDLNEVKQIGLTPEELERVRLRKDDLLIVEGHGNPEEIGRSAVWDGSIENCVHQNHLIRVRVNSQIITALYSSFFINSSGGRNQMLKAGKTTSGLNTISTKNVKETKVAVPPIDLQNQFANIVEKVENLKSRYQQSLSELENLFGTLSQKAFKGELDLSRVVLPVDQAETREET